jgi:hypothetical protein
VEIAEDYPLMNYSTLIITKNWLAEKATSGSHSSENNSKAESGATYTYLVSYCIPSAPTIPPWAAFRACTSSTAAEKMQFPVPTAAAKLDSQSPAITKAAEEPSTLSAPKKTI